MDFSDQTKQHHPPASLSSDTVMTDTFEMKEPASLNIYPSAPFIEPAENYHQVHNYLGNPDEYPVHRRSIELQQNQGYLNSSGPPPYQSVLLYPQLSPYQLLPDYPPVHGYPQASPVQPVNLESSLNSSQSESNQGHSEKNTQNNHAENISTAEAKVPKDNPLRDLNDSLYYTKDAKELAKAMKGFGINKKAIIQILTRRTIKQRLLIESEFKTLYGRDLVCELKHKTSGKLSTLLVALMTPVPKLYAKQLHCMDDDVFVEVMCTMTEDDIKVIEQEYSEMYQKLLFDDLAYYALKEMMCLKKSLSMGTKAFRKDQERATKLKNIMLLSAVQGVSNKPLFFAERLHKCLIGESNNYHQLIRIMVTRSEVDLDDIAKVYKAEYGEKLEASIENACSGYFKKCLLGLLGLY